MSNKICKKISFSKWDFNFTVDFPDVWTRRRCYALLHWWDSAKAVMINYCKIRWLYAHCHPAVRWGGK